MSFFFFLISTSSIAVCQEQRMLVNCWDRCKARPLFAGLIHFFFYSTECCFERLSTRALEQEVVFRSSGSFSLRAVSLLNSPGVITAKIRLSIRRYYHQAWGCPQWIHSLPHTCTAPPHSPCGRDQASSEGQSHFYGSSYSLFWLLLVSCLWDLPI